MAEIRNLWNEGLSCAEIAERTGRSLLMVVEYVDLLESR